MMKKTSAGNAIAGETSGSLLTAAERRQKSAVRIVELCRKLYPVKGLIVSPELDAAFSRIKVEYPDITLHEYPTGALADDWEVPPSWEAVEASITDDTGRVWASLEDSFLLVAPYSEPVDGVFTKEELAKHCLTNPTVPDSYCLQHRHAYNYVLTDWGITLPHSLLVEMPSDRKYRLVIRTRVQPGKMQVAEWFLPGKRKEVICFCSQFDELCNDGQSSAILGLELFRYLSSLPEREFSYQFLAVPEMFGSLFYAFNNQDVVNDTVAMFNLETVGAGEKWVLKKAFEVPSVVQQALKKAFVDLEIEHAEYGFFDGFGNDERVYNWPSIGIPGVALQRHPFREYHTGRDTPDILNLDNLAEALEICETTVSFLERNLVPRLNSFLPPWLTKHGLYFDATLDTEKFGKLNNLVLFSVDGKRTILDLADRAELPFDVVQRYIAGLAERDLVRLEPAPMSQLRVRVGEL